MPGQEHEDLSVDLYVVPARLPSKDIDILWALLLYQSMALEVKLFFAYHQDVWHRRLEFRRVADATHKGHVCPCQGSSCTLSWRSLLHLYDHVATKAKERQGHWSFI